jgi:mono/diheme cytochrome c family protein
MTRPTLAALALAALALPAGAQDAAEGEALYAVYCASCHGADATGGGPTAEILSIRPADLTGLAAGNDGVFPLARVARQIDGRDPLLAHGGAMPVYGPFFEGDEVAMRTAAGQPILMGRAMADLIAWLEGIQRD